MMAVFENNYFLNFFPHPFFSTIYILLEEVRVMILLDITDRHLAIAYIPSSSLFSYNDEDVFLNLVPFIPFSH